MPCYILHNDLLTNAFENNHFVSGSFLDLSKALNSLHYDFLLIKRDHYGIRGLVFTRFKSYLSDRSQSAMSIIFLLPRAKSCGVPKGCSLGYNLHKRSIESS